MGEIKHGFTAGKMNKDLDERLVQQGEYRDAMNIQVRTTSGDGDGTGIGDSGVVQNLQGNIEVGSATGDVLSSAFADSEFTCIGSIANEKSDCAYFLFTTDVLPLITTAEELVRIDTIIEHNVSSGANTPVVVDRWALRTLTSNVWSSAPTGTITTFEAISTLPAKIRENMTITFYDNANPTDIITVKIKKIDGNTIHLYEQATATWSNFTHARFQHPRVLNFSKKTLINGINIIDDLLFFTDGKHEPKKINITKCKSGTDASGVLHTKLLIQDPTVDQLTNAGDAELVGLNADLLEEHVTVLRPAPKTPPTIETETRDDAELQFNLDDFFVANGDAEINAWGEDPSAGDMVLIGTNFDNDGNEITYGSVTPNLSQVPFQTGDIFTVTQEDVEEGYPEVNFKVKFLGYFAGYPTAEPQDVPTDLIKVQILTEPNYNISSSMQSWSFKLSSKQDSKFELKFPRFGYRYKYDDGEYSAFSPWSELAFDPGLFDYDTVKGYNLGMVNTIKKIIVKDFIPYYTERPLNVVEVDLLYKTTESPNIYTVKTIKKIKDGEWELFTPDGNLDSNDSTQNSLATGALEITTEAIYKTLPSTQLLRTFDNVPRRALAQEITGSRILYGNYTQGFDIKYPVGLEQNVTSETVEGQPKKSLKSIRDYKVGMVFGDIYGRETPVIASNKISEVANNLGGTDYLAQTDDLTVPKELCAKSNRLSVKQIWDKPGLPAGDPTEMTWMEYVKYYVKETSNEYYNLVLDRWYKAKEENNIWLSFPSADRNKVDLETYLYLKKTHGNDEAVLEKARYKIIDIKNEAPDFIKTDTRNFGLINITGDPTADDYESPIGAADPQINEPSLLTSPSNTRIAVPGNSWNGFLNLYGENKRGQLFVRVVGRTENPASGAVFKQLNSGDFKKVTHHYVDGAGDGVVIYNESFLQSADMVERFAQANFDIDGNCASQCLQYFFEFKEEVVENKPEFDGRFFVLIEKDETTQDQIEITSDNEVQFTEIDLITLNYVDSQQYNPAQQGPYSRLATPTAGEPSVYNATTGLFREEDVGGEVLTDFTQPHEWWGFGRFSNNPQPYPGYWSASTTNAVTSNYPSGTLGDAGNWQYDSKQVHFFALGCRAASEGMNVDLDGDDYSETTYHFGYQNITAGDDGQATVKYPGTANYGGITLDYWATYKRFHRSSGNYSETDDKGYANPHLVFLDGARANQYQLMEFGTNETETNEQGVQSINDSNIILSNDSIAEGGIYPTDGSYPYAPSIYNYKPTALDQGHADEGTLGRMALSKIGDWGVGAGGSGAPAIYNYFAGASAAGTYFSFKDDKSDMSDPDFPDGKPYVYKVITVHPDDDEISLPVQKSKPLANRNFGYQFNHGQYDDSDSGCDNNGGVNFVRSRQWAPTTSVPNDDGAYFLNFGGENANCVDEEGNEVNCFEGLYSNFALSEIFDFETLDSTTHIRTGMYRNTGGFCNNRFHRICGQCDSSVSTGPYESGTVCRRESIRFEFRRINPVTGGVTNEGIVPDEFDPRGWAKHDGTHGGIRISILQPGVVAGGKEVKIEEDRAVWETEPKEDVGLDLYYEATHAIPMKLKKGNVLSYAPLKSKVLVERVDPATGVTVIDNLNVANYNGQQYVDVSVGGAEYLQDDVIIKVVSRSVTLIDLNGNADFGLHQYNIGIGDILIFQHSSGMQTRTVVEDYYVAPTGGENCTYVPQTTYTTTFTYDADADTISLANATNIVTGMNISGEGLPDGLFVSGNPNGTEIQVVGWPTSAFSWFGGNSSTLSNIEFKSPTGYYKVNKDVYKYKVDLGWHNCYSFGNGVESDRIRDDFNAPTIDNGVKVSTTIDEYGEENRTSGLIFSGLYNTTSGVNDLNEFNMGEKIIKDLNPDYGTIQALKTRDTNVVVFCEDKILKVIANKEAVFLADGNPQLTATDRVLGQVSTFLGDYGISRNPESLAKDNYRLYCTDSQRGAVLRISMDGITPISNVGMRTWFRENIVGSSGYGTQMIGTFDMVKGEYNLGISNQTMVAFNEGSKGWVSFRSFIPDQGVSVSGKYLTTKRGKIYKHHVDTFDPDTGEINNRNLFYGATTLEPEAESTITVMFNDVPGQVKSFKAMNYEGTQARVDQFISETIDGLSYTDGEYYNLINKKGWWVSDVNTDLQEGKITWFIDKENKWFNNISGVATSLENLDTSEFTVQGIGSPTLVTLPPPTDGDPTNTFTLTIKNKTNNDL